MLTCTDNELNCNIELLFIQAMYNPDFSSEAIQFIYENCKRYKLSKFEFNDKNKYIDIYFINDNYLYTNIMYDIMNEFIKFCINSSYLRSILSSIDSKTVNSLESLVQNNKWFYFEPYRVFNIGSFENSTIIRIDINR